MEIEEVQRLMLAAQVRELASGLRTAAAREVSSDTDAIAAWKAQHPVLEFVPAAVAKLREVVTAMG